MNNSELERLLNSVPQPDRPPEFWDRFPGRISALIQRQEVRKVSAESRPRHWNIIGWGAFAAACIVAGIVLTGIWRVDQSPNELRRNEKLLREVVAMFPDQVRAIVQDENGLRLLLSEEPNIPQSQPLWVKVCDGDHCRTAITFSGQILQLADQRVEVLADDSTGVMLIGEHFFWSTKQSSLNDRLRIVARPLNYSL